MKEFNSYNLSDVDEHIIESSRYLTMTRLDNCYVANKILLKQDSEIPSLYDGFTRCFCQKYEILPLLLMDENAVKELFDYNLCFPFSITEADFVRLRVGSPAKNLKPATFHQRLSKQYVLNYRKIFNLITHLVNPINLHFINKSSPIQQIEVVEKTLIYICQNPSWFKSSISRPKNPFDKKTILQGQFVPEDKQITLKKIIVASIASFAFQFPDPECPYELLQRQINKEALVRMFNNPFIEGQACDFVTPHDILFLEESGLL